MYMSQSAGETHYVLPDPAVVDVLSPTLPPVPSLTSVAVGTSTVVTTKCWGEIMQLHALYSSSKEIVIN